MKQKLEETYRAVVDELAALDRKRAELLIEKRALERAGAGAGAPALLREKPQRKHRKRAPTGHLEATLLTAMDPGKPMTNESLRAALSAVGYAFSVSRAHLSKTLVKMRDAGVISVDTSGPVNYYTRAPEKPAVAKAS
jgi:hypothetical protein